eukprot:6054054-Pleurochrysis_carterae.AAC.1
MKQPAAATRSNSARLPAYDRRSRGERSADATSRPEVRGGLEAGSKHYTPETAHGSSIAEGE